MAITVKSQVELDAALADPTISEITIDSPKYTELKIDDSKGKYIYADGSSTVRADGSSTVRADGSSTVRAYGSSTVRAGKFTSVHLTSKKATVTGPGHVIDMTAVDLNVFADWAEFHGVEVVRGRAIVFKAVNDDLRSPRGFDYPLGKTVTASDWEPGDFCGSGLHFSPSPIQARDYFENATRFLKVSVPVKDLSVIDGDGGGTPKLKAKSAKVIAEVNLMGDEITAPVAEVQA
jgi:hypothetical protein